MISQERRSAGTFYPRILSPGIPCNLSGSQEFGKRIQKKLQIFSSAERSQGVAIAKCISEFCRSQFYGSDE
ncbi:MAG: hypothetical protein DME52_04685 [Verrucomicrobia bacterium]|nr:MAG: hypothetical protein DME52_04685 [Verrucomicrobiota bacterium]